LSVSTTIDQEALGLFHFEFHSVNYFTVEMLANSTPPGGHWQQSNSASEKKQNYF
jgi:hypothetical protein